MTRRPHAPVVRPGRSLGMGVLIVGCLFPAAPVQEQEAAQGVCAATPLEDRLPGVVAPMAGEAPVWLVDGSFGVWAGADQPVKSLWVLLDPGPVELSVTGRAVTGPDRLGFRAGIDGPVSDRLHLRSPAERAVVPGGASADRVQDHLFVPSYVFYPAPGCWQLDVRLGHVRRLIVVEQRGDAGPGHR